MARNSCNRNVTFRAVGRLQVAATKWNMTNFTHNYGSRKLRHVIESNGWAVLYCL